MPATFKLHAVRSITDDAYSLAPRLRVADVAELQAQNHTPLDALLLGVKTSDPCWTIIDEEKRPIGMFGVVPTGDSKYSMIWLLAADDLTGKHRREFLRRSREWVNVLHAKAPILGNFVDARNAVHIGWLRWVGCFFIGEREINGHLFKEFLHI